MIISECEVAVLKVLLMMRWRDYIFTDLSIEYVNESAPRAGGLGWLLQVSVQSKA